MPEHRFDPPRPDQHVVDYIDVPEAYLAVLGPRDQPLSLNVARHRSYP